MLATRCLGLSLCSRRGCEVMRNFREARQLNASKLSDLNIRLRRERNRRNVVPSRGIHDNPAKPTA